jgi:hypothetical protein
MHKNVLKFVLLNVFIFPVAAEIVNLGWGWGHIKVFVFTDLDNN